MKKILYVSGITTLEYMHMHDGIIYKLGAIRDVSVEYFFTDVHIGQLIERILTYDKKTVVILYSISYNIYHYIKTHFNRIILFNPVCVSYCHSLIANICQHFMSDYVLIAITKNIFHSGSKYIDKHINICNKTHCLIQNIITYKNDNIIYDCEILDSAYVIISKHDLLTNVNGSSIHYCNGMHILTNREEEEFVDIITNKLHLI
jgi:hypothetical protein